MANGAFWIGTDGNVWVQGDQGTNNAGKADANTIAYWTSKGFNHVNDPTGLTVDNQIYDMQLAQQDPNAVFTTLNGANYNYAGDPIPAGQETGYSSGGGGGGGAAAAPVDPQIALDAAERARLLEAINKNGATIDTVYQALFGDLDTLLKSQDAELTTQYGEQRGKAGEQYAGALPEIDSSYAALGSYDSTQRTDSRGKAKTGYEDTLETIGTNETKDKAAVGQYGKETKAKIEADKTSAKNNVANAGTTTDLGALRGLNSDLQTNLDTTGVTKATLGTTGAARKELSDLTKDNGRYEAATTALDAILKSSMSGGVKAAAVQAVTDSAGLTDEEKKKVQETYGNVYAEQSAL